MSPAGFIGCFLPLGLLPSMALSNASLQTRIIPGGEVSISEVEARYDRQSISVSGTGFEIFPRQTCGHPEIAFLVVVRHWSTEDASTPGAFSTV